jgi:hypothetical protein
MVINYTQSSATLGDLSDVCFFFSKLSDTEYTEAAKILYKRFPPDSLPVFQSKCLVLHQMLNAACFAVVSQASVQAHQWRHQESPRLTPVGDPPTLASAAVATVAGTLGSDGVPILLRFGALTSPPPPPLSPSFLSFPINTVSDRIFLHSSRITRMPTLRMLRAALQFR